MRSLFSPLRVLRAAPLVILAILSACSDNDDAVDSTQLDTPREPASLTDGQTAELDAYIEEAIGRYRVPGTAVAIVRGRDVVYQGTFGVRGIDDPQPVTPETRFAIGSVAKSMTTLMTATLADEGKIDWDARVTDILPTFALSNPASTPQIRVRDLLNGTSGVPRFDSPFFVRTFSPTELIDLVGSIPTVAAPGEVFGYSNAMVSVGGYVAALADGSPYDADGLLSTYERLMQERVFSPIGMSSTTFDIDAALAAADHARPHAYDGARDAVVATPLEVEHFVKSMTPAGGAWSNLRDLAAYASTQLSGVAPNGTRVVSSENLRELHTEEIANIPRGEWPTADRDGAGYAMGWFTLPDYRGMPALSHDGNTAGFTSEMFLVPEADLAVVVLANLAQANNFYGAVEQFAVETALSLEHEGDALQFGINEQFTSQFRDIAANVIPVSREQALPYLGTYEHGARFDFTEQGFVLLGDFGPIPLAAYADSGVFVRTGELAAMTLAAFDSNTAPTHVTLGLFGEEGLSQPYVLRRLGD
jgi:CubicO group peptidase (beta-lactamase class C family)